MRKLSELSVIEPVPGPESLYKYYKLKNEKVNDLWSHPSFPNYYIEVAFSKKGGARTSHFVHRKLIKDRLVKTLIEDGFILNADEVQKEENVLDNLFLDVIQNKSVGFELSFPDKSGILDCLLERVGQYVHFIANGKNEHNIKKIVFFIIYIGSLDYELGYKYNDYVENLRVKLKKMVLDIDVDFKVISVNKKDVLSSNFIDKLINKIII